MIYIFIYIIYSMICIYPITFVFYYANAKINTSDRNYLLFRKKHHFRLNLCKLQGNILHLQ